jgi:hypothetical protein
VKITCDTGKTRKLSELEPFQGDIKKMSKKSREKLISLIEMYGLRFPFYVWGDKIIDGHQKQDVLTNDFKYFGDVPVVEIQAENEKEAKELVLVSTSQHGTFDIEGLQDFTADLNMDDLDGLCLVDGPYIDLDLSLGDTGEPDPKKNVTPLEDNIEIVEDSGEDAELEVQECILKEGQVINIPDGGKFIVGSDLFFGEELIRHWNSRNLTRKIVL